MHTHTHIGIFRYNYNVYADIVMQMTVDKPIMGPGGARSPYISPRQCHDPLVDFTCVIYG